MRKADTFFRRKAKFVTDIVVSIKEMYHAIVAITHDRVINFYAYTKVYPPRCSPYFHPDPVCGEVKAMVFDNVRGPEDGVEYGTITYLYPNPQSGESLYLETLGGRRARIQDLYDYSMDELIYVYDELEKIYKYEKNRNK